VSMGAAVQNLLIALAVDGLGSAWISSTLFCQDVAARAMDLPDGWRPMGAIAVDYPDERRSAAEQAMFTVSMGAAVQNLLIALAVDGLGSAWISSTLFCQDVAARAMDLPDGWRPMGAIAVGHPAERARTRPPSDPGDFILTR